jgi:hypothetical protein
MLVLRTMWKDWGLTTTLRGQATHFLELAKQTRVGSEQEGYVRASILFSVMSFEAFFFREIIWGFIEQNSATLDPKNAQKVDNGLNGRNGRFTGIKEAVKTWPCLLTRRALDPSASADLRLLEYRNALAHGDITKQLQGGKLAQEVETVADAEFALNTIEEFKEHVARHFGFAPPP